MVDLFPMLLDATKSMSTQLEQWFASYSPGMPYTVVSDYCINDVGKGSDVFSFVIIANHDTTENICEYIAVTAPRDLKSTNKVPLGLVQYLTSPVPVTFSVSFALKRESALLRNYTTVHNMVDFIPDLAELVRAIQRQSGLDTPYFDQVLKRVEMFGHDLARKQLNAKLARQVHLAAAFAAIVFQRVYGATRCGHLRWISDRDALVQRYDTLVYDLAYIYFLLMESDKPEIVRDDGVGDMSHVPKFRFELPEKTGAHRFDELIRLPDYLAGTLADVNLATLTYSRDKFAEVLASVFVDSPNNWIVQVDSTAVGVVARTAYLRGP